MALPEELKDFNWYRYIAKDCIHHADKETASNIVRSSITYFHRFILHPFSM